MDPVCGLFSLHLAAMLISLLSIARAICCFAVVSTYLILATFYKEFVLEQLDKWNLEFEFINLPSRTMIGLTVFLLVVFVIEMPFFVFIYRASRDANMKGCLYWWRTKITLICIAIIVGIVAVIMLPDKLFISGFGIAALIYDFYLLWIIKSYVNEMQSEKKQQHKNYSTKVVRIRKFRP